MKHNNDDQNSEESEFKTEIDKMPEQFNGAKEIFIQAQEKLKRDLEAAGFSVVTVGLGCTMAITNNGIHKVDDIAGMVFKLTYGVCTSNATEETEQHTAIGSETVHQQSCGADDVMEFAIKKRLIKRSEIDEDDE